MFFVDDRDALATYRYLRVGVPLLTVLLGAAVAYQIFSTTPDCWLGSISAYYYTSARAVFVACLCAIGVSLIVYNGNTPREDFFLNFSGLLAFVVAFVPTPLAKLQVSGVNPVKEPVCKRINVPTDDQLNAAIDNNLFAYLFAATAALGVVVWFRQRKPPPQRGGLSIAVLGVGLALGWFLYVVNRGLLRDHAHLYSAIAMFGGIVVVVFLNAYRFQLVDPQAISPPAPYVAGYRVIFWLMVAAIVIIGGAALFGNWDHAIFWLEASLISFFAAYWVVQTQELWASTHRDS